MKLIVILGITGTQVSGTAVSYHTIDTSLKDPCVLIPTLATDIKLGSICSRCLPPRAQLARPWHNPRFQKRVQQSSRRQRR